MAFTVPHSPPCCFIPMPSARASPLPVLWCPYDKDPDARLQRRRQPLSRRQLLVASENLHDLVRQADDQLGQYTLQFTLSTPLLARSLSHLPTLVWHSVPYGREYKDTVPNDQRGLYAFVIATPEQSLPTHGYVCYIGMSGKNSRRSLRERYSDYLDNRKIAKRIHIARMIVKWESVLRFFFAPVGDDVTSEEIFDIEKTLNDTFQPPFSRGDYSARVRTLRKAFP